MRFASVCVAAVMATLIGTLSYAAWAGVARCNNYAVTQCPAQQGCSWIEDTNEAPKQMCKTLCGSPDPCAGAPSTCCSWTWTKYIKEGPDCSAEPAVCWVVSSAHEVSAKRCSRYTGGQWVAYGCCDQQGEPAECHTPLP